MAYARAIGATNAEARAYRADFGSRELMLIWPDSSASVTGDAIARAMGLRAWLDETTGWHKTISNVTVPGITTVTQDVHYDLLDNDTDAGLLNDADITTIIRTSAGYRFWGNRTCAGDDQGQLPSSAVRTQLCLAGRDRGDVCAVLRPAHDRGPVKDLLETVNARFRKYTLRGWIMGAQAFFDADANTSGELAAGRPISASSSPLRADGKPAGQPGDHRHLLLGLCPERDRLILPPLLKGTAMGLPANSKTSTPMAPTPAFWA
jgi:phage tail sheath protein FI